MVAKGFISINHIPSHCNVADTLSKDWGHQSNYENLIKPLLNYFDYISDDDDVGVDILEEEFQQLVDNFTIELSID